MAFKTGKLPKKVDGRTLQLAKYLIAPKLPAPPASVDWEQAVADWEMLGNDTVGDCAWAGQAHADMLWAANIAHQVPAITTDDVLAAYSAVTGYDPSAPPDEHGENPTDRGTALLDALNYWRDTGIDGRKIDFFVEVDPRNVEHVKLAIDLFGCVYIGVQFPDSVEPTSAENIPDWTVVPDGSPGNEPDPNNGHCVVYGAYDEDGPRVVTWGTTIKASWAFHTAYCDEAYAMLSPDWFGQTGKNPEGLDLATLKVDLGRI